MKLIILASSLFFAASASAGVADVSPTRDASVSPARVEKVYTVQSAKRDDAALKLIQVDNGGSTDVSSVTLPSTLYVGIYKDGEEADLDTNYEVAGDIYRITSVKFEKKSSVVRVEFERKNDRFEIRKSRMNIFVNEALKEAKVDGGTILESTIGVQRIDD